MITVLGASTIVGTTASRQSVGGAGLKIAFYDPEDVEMDCGYLLQGSTFSPLNWKEVFNWQTEGVVDAYSQDFVNRFFPGTEPKYYQSGTRWCSDIGIQASDGTWLVPFNSVYHFAQPSSNIEGAGVIFMGCATKVSETTFKWCQASASFTQRQRRIKGRLVNYSSLSTGKSVPAGAGITWSNDYDLDRDGYFESFQKAVAHATKQGDFTSPKQVAAAGGYSARLSRLYTTKYGAPTLTIEYLKRIIHHNGTNFVSAIHEEEFAKEPELHAKSFDGVQKFDGNMLVLTSKLNDFGQVTIKSLFDFMGSDLSRQSIASFWLANRYGDRLSIGGVSDLIRAIDKEFLTIHPGTTRFIQSRGRLNGHHDDGMFKFDYSLGANLAVTPKDWNGLMRLIREAYTWDWYPSLSNVWDAIPLSFVVDWFANVGDIYKSVDRMVYSRYYDVKCILQSVKAECVDPFLPGVTHKYYERTFRKALRLTVDSVELGLPSFINVFDGAALLLG